MAAPIILPNTSPFASWMTYFKERFPFGTYLFLALGFSLSGAQGSINVATGIATIGVLLFFAELRLMDEFKDYAKDRVAHPQRPLPRGILQLSQVKDAIDHLFLILLGFGGGVGMSLSYAAGSIYILIGIYLWLMYKEFYIGAWLSKYPLLYAITHQVILIPLCLFCFLIQQESWNVDPIQISYSITVFGSFFSYEVCRKLNPKAHPMLKTYLFLYGPCKTSLLVLGLLGIAGWGAFELQMHGFLWPVEAVLALSLAILYIRPSSYRLVEGMATLSLALHIWSLVVGKIFP